MFYFFIHRIVFIEHSNVLVFPNLIYSIENISHVVQYDIDTIFSVRFKILLIYPAIS